MAVAYEILVNLKDYNSTYEVWEKLRVTNENTGIVNKVHLMRKLVSKQLD